ncbi:HupE/UreJ family protein [soil metagenome]
MRPIGALLLVFFAAIAQAHKPSDSYLTVRAEPDTHELDVQWDIALADLEHGLGLDVDGDRAITWGELKARENAVSSYALERLDIAAGEAPCPPGAVQLLFDEHSDGGYAVLRFVARCPAGPVRIEYQLFFDIDPTHRGLLRFDAGDAVRAAVLTPGDRVWTQSSATAWDTFRRFVAEGVWHIWIGYDHIAFLLLLLLPVVLVRGRHGWRPARSLRAVAYETLKIVTAFTAAHSITLSLAALGIVTLPAKPVEIAIAASVIAAGVYNLLPRPVGRGWMIAFGFGLVHGFGFANVLADLGLAGGDLAVTLAAFNIGVELGQLAIVAAFLPAIFVLRRKGFYRRVILPAGSLAIALVACWWLAARV